MIHKVFFEHYIMDGKRRIEPVSGEYEMCNDVLMFISKFEQFKPEETPISVLQTPWGRYAQDVDLSFELYSDDKEVTVRHSLLSSNKPDKADWWKESNV